MPRSATLTRMRRTARPVKVAKPAADPFAALLAAGAKSDDPLIAEWFEKLLSSRRQTAAAVKKCA